MKFILHSHFPAGHAYPMQAVAQELAARGHRVVWLTSADNEARVRAVPGVEFLATGPAAAEADAELARAGETGLLDGDHARRARRMGAQVEDYRRAGALLSSSTSTTEAGTGAADVLLVDVLPHGARALQELGEIPVFATLGVIPLYTSSSRAPHPVSGAAPPSSLPSLVFNALRHLFHQWIALPLLLRPILNRQRQALGLRSLPWGEPAEAFKYSPFLHIQASSSTLEFNQRPKSEPHTSNTAFVGPLVAPANVKIDSLPDWWLDVVSHPKVVGVTQGTLAMDPTSLIVPTIEALAPNRDLLLVVVSPHAAEIASRTGSPPNVRFAAWLPYHLLLPQLSLLVTNGGYGSITQALSHRVPLLCAGQTEDKPDTAARVAWCGVGIDLGTDSPSPSQVAAAARRILDDAGGGGYQQRVRELGDELNRLGGAGRACDLLEELGEKYADKTKRK